MLTLLYHNVLKTRADGLPVAGHQVTIDTFRSHVRRFRGQLLHPLEVHDELMRGSVPRGVLITFDDGADGIEYASEVLAEAGKAGVAFICPGAVKSGLWFYRLADSIVRATTSLLRFRDLALPIAQPAEKRKAYAVVSKRLFDLPPAVRNEDLEEIETSLKLTSREPHPALRVIDEAGLQRTAQTGGMIFANHSWSHPNLVKMPTTDLTYEIEATQEWLVKSGLPFVPWFAFPRGNYDERVNSLLAGICPVLFGAKAREPDPRILPRTYIREADSNPLRLGAKTAWEGRLRSGLLWR
jgi:peptidoglycan/xylan/chitin deacetylase (PgdA/CDA1 family)